MSTPLVDATALVERLETLERRIEALERNRAVLRAIKEQETADRLRAADVEARRRDAEARADRLARWSAALRRDPVLEVTPSPEARAVITPSLSLALPDPRGVERIVGRDGTPVRAARYVRASAWRSMLETDADLAACVEAGDLSIAPVDHADVVAAHDRDPSRTPYAEAFGDAPEAW
jgi:hypothetical protein